MNALKERRVQVAILAVVGLVVATALLTGILTARASKAGSVGYLRIQEVLSKWPSFLEANKQFNDYADQLQEDYKEKLEKATGDEKQELLKEIQDKMQKTNDEMVKPYDEMLQRAIDEAKRYYGLDIVLSSEYVVAGGADITEKVTALVNEYSEAAK
jgi:Skp family chaperone for outer membrane proteins